MWSKLSNASKHNSRKTWLLALLVAGSIIVIWQLIRINRPPPALSPFSTPLQSFAGDSPTAKSTAAEYADWTFDVNRDARNLGFSNARCEAAFPDLFQELDKARDWHRADKPNGGITEEDVGPYDGRAQIRLFIYDGQLRLLDTWGIEGPHQPDRPVATIQAIHRALTSHPDPASIPNIEFTIDTQDDGLDGGPRSTVWTYCRHTNSTGTWLMPDFGFWSFPSHTVGSYDEFRSQVKLIEAQSGSFSSKINKLVWRGQEGSGGEVRRPLVEMSANKPWSDVRWLDWFDNDSILQMHDHCKYKFTAHTEGVTWSGRLRYLQNCNNVVVTHKLEYDAHYYHLMVPSGPRQNVVQVERDYTDLDEKMTALINNPQDAERIAAENTRVFRDLYLTPAAEACYWRRMFTTWKEVQGFEPRIWTDGRPGEEGPVRWRGSSWERYVATGDNWRVDPPPT